MTSYNNICYSISYVIFCILYVCYMPKQFDERKLNVGISCKKNALIIISFGTVLFTIPGISGLFVNSTDSMSVYIYDIV